MTGGSLEGLQVCASWAVTKDGSRMHSAQGDIYERWRPKELECAQVGQSRKNASRTHSAQGDIDDRWKPSGEADVCKLSSHRKMRPGRTVHKET